MRCGTYIIYSCCFHAEIFTETINLSWRILKKIDTKVQILIYKSHTNFAIILQNNHEYQKCKNNYNQTVKQFTTFKKRLKSLKKPFKTFKKQLCIKLNF